MRKEVSITEARKQLTTLPDRLAKGRSEVVITRHGEPVLALLPWETYEAIVETLEIMADEQLMAELRKSVMEAAAGKTIAWERVKSDPGL